MVVYRCRYLRRFVNGLLGITIGGGGAGVVVYFGNDSFTRGPNTAAFLLSNSVCMDGLIIIGGGCCGTAGCIDGKL